MMERLEDRDPHPLPREWLPDPHPPAGAPDWDAKIGRIMAAADPELRILASGHAALSPAGWSTMGRWWKPAAALAAAVIMLLLATERPSDLQDEAPASLSLSLVATNDDPLALWEASLDAFGIRADPVLALIALHEQAGITGQSLPGATAEEKSR
jgi:hypothetical protein